MNEKIDLDALLNAVGADPVDRPEPVVSEFGQQLASALERAVEFLRREELVDVADDKLESLLTDVTAAGLEARSPKQLMKRVVRTMIESEDVEEVYGTDEMLFEALRRFLDPE